MRKTRWILPLFVLACLFTLSACNDHVHDFGEWTTVKAATCTEQGEQERACACGEKQTQSMDAGHTEVVVDPAVDATCTAKGKTEGKHCSACGYVLVSGQEIPAKGHEEMTTERIPPTCGTEGATEGTYCSRCDEVLTASTVIPAKGHEKKITSNQILPTCEAEGMSEGAYCSWCDEVLSVATPIPAKGYDWMLEDGEFKILLIGNSFTEDASNYAHNVQSQLYTILQAMLGKDVKITIAILVNGDRGMNWHATQAYNNAAIGDFRVYTSKAPYWKSYGPRTHAQALQWTNWDVVSLQPYGVNPDTGIESNNFPAETHFKFLHIADSTAYLLDFVHNNAPQAEVYCYMHWAFSTATGLNANLSKYNKMAAFYPSLLEYQGTETGKRFTTLVPVGLSVQNARTTYLALLAYNTNAYIDKTLNYTTDGQIGLQRDQGHLSYNIGRYIAALTFAEMIVPESLRAENYTIPSIRKTESIGKLPERYSLIAQLAVKEAVRSWKEGNLSVADLSYHAKDPTTLFAENFAAGLTLKRSDTVDTIKRTVTESINARSIQDLVIEKIEFPVTITPGKDFQVSVTVRFGYTTLEFKINCMF